MLTTASMMQSKPLAALAGNKNVTITVASGTPVQEMSKPCFSALLTLPAAAAIPGNDVTSGDGFDSVYEHAALVVSSMSGGTGESVHDQALDGFVDDVSHAVAAHLSYAKNVVKPAIVDMVEQVHKYMQEAPQVGSEFNIHIHDIPAAMQDSSFENSIKKFEGAVFVAPDTAIMLKEKAPQEILELLHTGSGAYDEKVNEWFAKMGDVWFMNAFNNLFTDIRQTKPSEVFTFEQALTRDAEYDDYALFVYLIASKIYEDVQEGTGLSLSRYKEVVAQYKNAAGVRLLNCYKKYESDAKLNMLVVSYSADRKSMTVNGHVYRPWIAAGNDNDVLMGLLTTTNNVYNSKAIEEKSPEYKRIWVEYLNLQSTATRNRSFIRFKEVLSIAFEQGLRQPFEAEKDFIKQNNAYLQNVSKYFQEQLDCVSSTDMKDVYGVCTKLMCRARFYYTDAEKILCSINAAMQNNPSMDVREAALIATIEYVCDYIADQLVLQ